jgi:hypothetical protein
MLTRNLLILGGAASIMFAQPKITYQVGAGANVGVSTLTAGDPDFDAELNAFVLNPRSSLPDLREVKPYVLIVRNNSTSAIARLSVRHEVLNADGPPRPRMLTLGGGAAGGTVDFAPGERLLVFTGIQNVAPGAASARPEQIAHHASVLRQAKEIVVILDSVIFDSGLIVGPDKNGNSDRYQAEQQAVRDMLRDLQALKVGGAPAAQMTKEYLDRLAKLSPGRILPIEDDARDTAFHYSRTQAGLARWFLFRALDLDGCIVHLASVNGRMKNLHH